MKLPRTVRIAGKNYQVKRTGPDTGGTYDCGRLVITVATKIPDER